MPRRTILIVDDDPGVLEFYRRIFSPGRVEDFSIVGQPKGGTLFTDIKCRTYADPLELVSELRRAAEQGIRHPLCVVDMRMPQQNGLVTAEQLRAIDADIDIVICTAAHDFAPEEIRRRLGERVFFVHKPFDAGEFAFMIQSLVDYWESRQELRRRTAFLAGLLEASADLIFMKDRQGIYLTCNKRFADFARKTPQEIIGGTDCDFLPQEMCAVFREQDRQVIESRQPLVHRAEVDHPDGGRCLLETVKSPVHADDGACIGILGIARDISGRNFAQTPDDVGL